MYPCDSPYGRVLGLSCMCAKAVGRNVSVPRVLVPTHSGTIHVLCFCIQRKKTTRRKVFSSAIEDQPEISASHAVRTCRRAFQKMAHWSNRPRSVMQTKSSEQVVGFTNYKQPKPTTETRPLGHAIAPFQKSGVMSKLVEIGHADKVVRTSRRTFLGECAVRTSRRAFLGEGV